VHVSNGRVFRPIWLRRETILDRRIWVYYLVILDRVSEHLADTVEVKPDERFFKTLGTHVEQYLETGEAPEALRSVVMNVADDYLAGREIVLRAGDYIALQNYARQAK
jgi:molybdopterin converting factor small subunit